MSNPERPAAKIIPLHSVDRGTPVAVDADHSHAHAGPQNLEDAHARGEPCGSCRTRPLGLCAPLDAAQLELVAHTVARRRLSAHDILYQADHPADTVYFVASGALKLYQLLADGRRQIVAFPYPGDMLGYSRGTYGAAAESLTETVVCCFSRSAFDRLLNNMPELRESLIERAGLDLLVAQQQITLLGRKTSAERLASFLLQIQRKRAVTCGAALQLPMTRADIGDYLGLTTETVSRTFSHFRLTGLLRLHGADRVEIVQAAELARLAEGGA